ncbi:protein-tyrosine phosphatase family protein [Allosalinactinospora lopnorensis]|uniref:protein-tyrosine phosphatase family protein n=1 Tax=Allosalinactinospora lopnorensis TaxID=1352348 RepID=UPI001F2D0ECB|nr:dual specificity protein phosphatase family protein [Allosalinactinospora lopnorensis]
MRIAGGADQQGWPTAARHPRLVDARSPFSATHPHDDGVVLGNLALADAWSTDVDAVVSLCRVGAADFAEVPRRDHVHIWLIDAPGTNAHVHYALDQAARAVAGLRAEGKRVLLHCAAGRSRTPTAAARYSTLTQAIPPSEALKDVMAAITPNRPAPSPELESVLYHLSGEPAPAQLEPLYKAPRMGVRHNQNPSKPEPLFEE